jgi:hypothetical protein
MGLFGTVPDGGDVTLWNDLTTPAEDAAPVSGSPHFQAPPTFHEAGAALPEPCVRLTAGTVGGGVTNGLVHVNPDTGSFTRYLVLSNLTPPASGAGVILIGHNGGPFDFGLYCLSDGRVGAAVNANAFDNTFDASDDAFDDGEPHILTFAFDLGVGHWYLYVDGVLVADHACNPQFTGDADFIRYGASSAYSDPSAGYDLHEEAHWDAVHDADGRASVLAVLRASWGIP